MANASLPYERFVREKLAVRAPSGIPGGFKLPDSLFPLQGVLASWALKRGRAAIFADTGLGKSRIELSWADAVRLYTGQPVLILAPLAVASQTAGEGAQIGIDVTVCRDGADVNDRGINITNYDRIHRFDPSIFGGVVLDESSCIKHADSRTFATLTDAFQDTSFRLAATATPAPNDWTELGTHAEFLGICKKVEMLAEFFTHDSGDTSTWRLKGHARATFWKWVAAWGAMVRKPSDLGFDDGAYNLPNLCLHQHTVEVDTPFNGMLYATEAMTLNERRAARRQSLAERVGECAQKVNSERNESWLVWCELNDESARLTAEIEDAVEVKGSDAPEVKEERLLGFAKGKYRVLVSKPSIAGWGMNFQACSRMAFVGVTDSYESYYQAVRRCWRFGQKREVHVHIFASKAEGSVVENLKRKELNAAVMAEALGAETREVVMTEVVGASRQTNIYDPASPVQIPSWLARSAA